jgi:hypothetical protein
MPPVDYRDERFSGALPLIHLPAPPPHRVPWAQDLLYTPFVDGLPEKRGKSYSTSALNAACDGSL